MTTYIITFEIKDPQRKSLLKKRLQEEGFYCPIHDNAWAIRTEKKATELRDILMKIAISPDKLFIIRTGTEAAWTNAYDVKNSEWLKKYL